jgi:hypothetical protein
MIRGLVVSLLAVTALGLAGCGEKPQTAATKKADSQAWQASSGSFVAEGWKVGDQASWEEQLRSRAQGQNDYSRVR